MQAERLYKEVRHQLTMEKEVICNGDLIVSPQRMKSEVIKNDVYCGIRAIQKRFKLEAWWPEYLRDIKQFIKNTRNV